MMDNIKLDRHSPQKPELPSDIKILHLDSMTIICRWNGFGWKQVSSAEAREILREFNT